MTAGSEVTILNRDERERSGPWFLVRRSLGLKAFGMNLVEITPRRADPRAPRDRDEEDVFVVLRGSPSLVVDG